MQEAQNFNRPTYALNINFDKGNDRSQRLSNLGTGYVCVCACALVRLHDHVNINYTHIQTRAVITGRLEK